MNLFLSKCFKKKKCHPEKMCSFHITATIVLFGFGQDILSKTGSHEKSNLLMLLNVNNRWLKKNIDWISSRLIKIT